MSGPLTERLFALRAIVAEKKAKHRRSDRDRYALRQAMLQQLLAECTPQPYDHTECLRAAGIITENDHV